MIVVCGSTCRSIWYPCDERWRRTSHSMVVALLMNLSKGLYETIVQPTMFAVLRSASLYDLIKALIERQCEFDDVAFSAAEFAAVDNDAGAFSGTTLRCWCNFGNSMRPSLVAIGKNPSANNCTINRGWNDREKQKSP
eukprot:scaffold4927_cov139-Amphora_coffeaeformis.AAC.2